ncbi:MAG: hypothetical protein NTZ10_02170 [Candidatus Saganbacteria bacterium]|nr:hypothetical protein [Candidatus Saganbacteria bacterium]
MKKTVLAAAVLIMTAACVFAAPELKDLGVSAGSFTENKVLETKTVWMSQPEQWMVFWGKIEPKSDYDGDSPRYYGKIEFISPDNTLKMTEGPIAFDPDGTAKIFKTTSYFINAKTPEVPKPFVFGRWTANFYMFDERNSETVLAKTANFELMEMRPVAPAVTTPEAVSPKPSTTVVPVTPGIMATVEPSAVGTFPTPEVKSGADKANEEEVKKLKAELDEIKKLLEKKNERPARKARPKPAQKKAPVIQKTKSTI